MWVFAGRFVDASLFFDFPGEFVERFLRERCICEFANFASLIRVSNLSRSRGGVKSAVVSEFLLVTESQRHEGLDSCRWVRHQAEATHLECA